VSETDPMNIDERRKYLQRMWERYHYASKADKTMLLDEMEAVTGMHRKSIIRLMKGRRGRKKRERERGKAYGTQVEDALRVIARSLDYPCAERLQPNLVFHGTATLCAWGIKGYIRHIRGIRPYQRFHGQTHVRADWS